MRRETEGKGANKGEVRVKLNGKKAGSNDVQGCYGERPDSIPLASLVVGFLIQ